MGGDEKTCRGLILLGIFSNSSPSDCGNRGVFDGSVCGFCPSPYPLPAGGERGACGGRRGLLPACGEKVPEGRMTG